MRIQLIARHATRFPPQEVFAWKLHVLFFSRQAKAQLSINVRYN